MINKMRELAPVIMLVILVAFVGGTIFLDWGMNMSGRGRKSMQAGKINGKEVPIQYFDQRVNQERQRLQQGDNEIPPQQYRLIPQQVWEQEVHMQLMHTVIGNLQLGATADEIYSYIKNNPPAGIDTVEFFQTDGKYDSTKYIQFLNDPNNYTTNQWLHQIEASAANIVPMKKIETLLSAGAQPTASEVAYMFKKQNSKIVFEYAKANASDFPVDSSAITDAMIEGYYTANKDSFKVNNQADIYFVKYPKVSTEFDENIYRQDLQDLKSRIIKADKPLSEAFAEEAAIESDDEGSAKRGGELGWFKRGMMVKEFDSIAFTLPVGEISEPVKTNFGLHLVYVEAREEKDSVMQVHARHILRKISPTMETLDMLAERADSMRIQILDNGFAVATQGDSTAQFDSTGLFEKGEAIPKIGYLSGAGTFVFKKSDLSVSERLENTEAFYLIAIKRTTEAGFQALEDAKEKIRTVVTDSLKLDEAQKHLESVKKKTPDTVSVALYSTVDSTIASGVTDTVSGGVYVTDIGYSSPVVAKAMALSDGEISSVIKDDKSCYLVKTLWKNIVDSTPSITDMRIMEVASKMQQQTAQRIYFDWYLDHKNSAKIKSNIDEIYVE